MKRILAGIFAAIMLCGLCGCNLENADSSYVRKTTASFSSPEPEESGSVRATTQTTAVTSLDVSDVIPEAIQTPRTDGNRLSFSIINVYSEGEYYTVDISGVKLDENTASEDIDTTYVKGELYGDFRLDLLKKGEIIDTFKINVPRDDRFLILESVTENLSYGCELISNKREYGADEYPDLIRLDFYIINEVEAPQYARYFAVFDGKIREVPVYENGVEVAPYGTHPEMKSAGLMVQHIVAGQYGGEYTILKYEYTFDVENRCLNRQKVKFYGWED